MAEAILAGIPRISFEGYFDTEEWLEYSKRLKESQGFDVPALHHVHGPLFGVIQPANVRDGLFDVRDGLFDYNWATMLAIQQLNKKDSENATFVLNKIVKICVQGVGPLTYYITFEAAAKDGVIKTYQAKVVQTFPKTGSFVEFVRLMKSGSSSGN